MKQTKIPKNPKFCPYAHWFQIICDGTDINEIHWECRLTQRACGVFTKKEPCELTKQK